jgi:uncharacterized protein YndB with AHSA1/START domain
VEGSIGPVRKSVTVALGVDDAFKLFTEGIAGWWPVERHSIGEDRVKDVVFEPSSGGEIYEVWDDGSKHHWAKISAYEASSRFVLQWKPNPERAAPTEVEVRFVAEGSGTRVELEHRGWERLGEEGPERRASYDGGWPVTLGRFAEAAA